MMARPGYRITRRSRSTLLTSLGFLTTIAIALTTAMRASDNLDYAIGGQIRDIVWDSRLFDGTPGFPGAILWYHNPSGLPDSLSQASAEAAIQSGFDTWKSRW
jgi:hypothetical protein